MDWTFTTDEPVRYEGGASKVDVYVIQAQPVSPWSVNSSSPNTLLFKDFLDVYNQVIASDRSIELSRENIVPIALKEPRFRLADDNANQYSSIVYELVESYQPRTAKVEFRLKDFLIGYGRAGGNNIDLNLRSLNSDNKFSVSTLDSSTFWNLLLRANGVEVDIACLRASEIDIESYDYCPFPLFFGSSKVYSSEKIDDLRILANHFLLCNPGEISTNLNLRVSDVSFRSYKHSDTDDGQSANDNIFASFESYVVASPKLGDLYKPDAYREMFLNFGSSALVYALIHIIWLK
jgi:hypothetical protein